MSLASIMATARADNVAVHLLIVNIAAERSDSSEAIF